MKPGVSTSDDGADLHWFWILQAYDDRKDKTPADGMALALK